MKICLSAYSKYHIERVRDFLCKQCLLLYTLGRLHEHSGSVGREAGSKIGNEARAFQSAGNGPSAIVVSTAPLAGLPEIYGRKNRQKRRWKKK